MPNLTAAPSASKTLLPSCALFGAVLVNDSYGYDVVIRAIEPGEDNGEAPLVGF